MARKKGAALAAAVAAKLPPRSNVVYLGRIPHGFFEDQMRGYFSQFGELRRLRLSRSKKTSRSRGYAYLEFAGALRTSVCRHLSAQRQLQVCSSADPTVAAVVAETMHGYPLGGKVLVAHTVDPAKVHSATFAGDGAKFRNIPWRTVARQHQVGS